MSKDDRNEDPRAPLHPQVEALFGMMSANRSERVLEPGPMREGMAALGALLAAGAPEVGSDREIAIPGPVGNIRARVFVPTGTGPFPVLVYFHGGGYVMMSPETHEKFTKELCVGAGAVVVSVDYRLAPEHPYPAPVDDCVAAVRWVHENAASVSGDAKRIAVAGDSAGGNATAAVCLRLADAGDVVLRAALMICPWTDMTLQSESMLALGPSDPVLDTDIMKFFRDSYVSTEQINDPGASVVLADLTHFPPTRVVVGGIDPLYDDGVEFARRLESAGCDVSLQTHEGMPHIFMVFPGIDEGPRSTAQMCEFLRERLA
jgi:acetyl esterase